MSSSTIFSGLNPYITGIFDPCDSPLNVDSVIIVSLDEMSGRDSNSVKLLEFNILEFIILLEF